MTKRLALGFLVLVTIAVGAGLLVLRLRASATSGTPYVIGVSVPLTKDGAANAEGEAMRQALQLYVDRLNAKGGIGGTPLALRVEDDGNDKERARKIAAAFAGDPEVLAVIGHQFSSVAIAAGETYQAGELVHISPSASNPKVTRGRDWVFSMNYQDELQGENMAVYLKAILGANNVVVLFADDAYGKGLRDSFGAKAKSLGLGIAREIEYSYDAFKAGDLPGALVKDRWPAGAVEGEGEGEGPPVDAIALFSHTGDGAALIRQIRGLGIELPAIGPDAFAKTAFIDALGEHTANVLVAGPFLYELSSLKTKQFVDEYSRAFEETYDVKPTVWAAFCYDALGLVTEAITEAITEAAAQSDTDAGVTRAAIRDYLAAIDTPAAAHEGITGKLYFDDEGAMQRSLVISMIEDGLFKPAFTQLKKVVEPHVLRTLPERVKRGEVVVVDSQPYYRTAVVYAGIDFVRINSVDVVGQNFDLEFFMWFRWVGETIDTARIDFLNGIYGIEDKVEVLRENLSGRVKYRCYKIKGTYLYPYKLQLFPFDTQSLPMTLSHKTKDANQLMLVLDKNNLKHAPITEIYPEEWSYIERVDYAGTYDELSTFGDPSYAGNNAPTQFSVYETNIVLERITFPYLFKLFLPLVMMIVISCFVFFVPQESFDARMTLVMTALLSVLVFHMSQGDALPAVGYMVKADQYFVATYFMLFVTILLTIGVNLLAQSGREDLARTVFRRCAWVMIPGTFAAFAYITLAQGA